MIYLAASPFESCRRVSITLFPRSPRCYRPSFFKNTVPLSLFFGHSHVRKVLRDGSKFSPACCPWGVMLFHLALD